MNTQTLSLLERCELALNFDTTDVKQLLKDLDAAIAAERSKEQAKPQPPPVTKCGECPHVSRTEASWHVGCGAEHKHSVNYLLYEQNKNGTTPSCPKWQEQSRPKASRMTEDELDSFVDFVGCDPSGGGVVREVVRSVEAYYGITK